MPPHHVVRLCRGRGVYGNHLLHKPWLVFCHLPAQQFLPIFLGILSYSARREVVPEGLQGGGVSTIGRSTSVIEKDQEGGHLYFGGATHWVRPSLWLGK